uniref:Rh-like protein n=2 Tax=Hirondellea gigas TaxID=1518452 RepID=A0A2P2I2S7_9CRUS
MQFRHQHKHAYLLMAIQLIFLVLFGIFVRYHPDADAKYHPSFKHKDMGTEDKHGGSDAHPVTVTEGGGHHPTYGMFQDVHVMIFVGFGFLMTFLKRYGFGAVGNNFLVAAVAVQWAILVNGFFHMSGGFIEVSLGSLLGADFVAATVLISFGALLGKTTPTQLLILTMIEIPIFVINEVLGRSYLGAIDMGDSMFVHAFGAYFGLAVSRVLAREDASTEKEGSDKTSDTFAMVGTLFLWLYWPSFNAGAAPGEDQHRAIINTYLALTASCVSAFAISSLLDPDKKFDMVHIQNSTLAGGVAIGTSADLMAQPFGALLVGIIAGVVSVFGYYYLTPFLASRLRVHDTCGVHNLHGMPALIAGVVGAVYASMATEEVYGPSLYLIFPLRAPENGTAELTQMRKELPGLEPGLNRTGVTQAGYQLLALLVTMVVSITGGLLTGAILKMEMLNKLETDDLYEDACYWKLEEEEEVEEQPGKRESSGSLNAAVPMMVSSAKTKDEAPA